MLRISLLLLLAAGCHAATYKAGTAVLTITPEEPIWLAGYGSRNRPSEGVIQDLKAKALAVEDERGGRLVVVTTDIIGLSRSVAETVAARVQKQWGLDRARLLLNSSHTHTGPIIRENLDIMFQLQPEQREVARRYAQKLTENLVMVIGAALHDLAPAEIRFGHGEATFAINRREPTAKGMRIGLNPGGPTDPDVPVIEITAGDRTKAVLFGYACHNTTLTGEFYKISGDYAGFAQQEVEKTFPGVTAMFLMLCGADQNPNPRSTLELAERHGKALAAEVRRVLNGRLEPVDGRVRAAFRVVELDFAHHTRGEFERRLQDENPVRVRHAQAMLKAYDERRPIRRYRFPVQALALGKNLMLVALGGEVVVDYALRLKKEFGARGLLVAGYSNDVMAYIPSRRVLKEGGYEAEDSMIYYGMPGRWAEDVEERVVAGVRHVMARAGRKR